MRKKLLFLFMLIGISFHGISQVTQGLNAYYAFQGNGIDSSIYGNNAILIGNATANGSLAVPYDDVSYLTIPYNVMHQLQDFSIAMWVRFNQFHTGTSSHYNTMISGANSWKTGGDNVGTYYQKYYSGPGGAWQLWLQDDYYIESTDTILPLNWYFVVFIREGTTAKLFKNGYLRTTTNNVYAMPLEIDPNGLVAGQEQDAVGSLFSLNQCLDGNIGKLRIYNRALNPSEVLQLYNNPVSVNDREASGFQVYPNPTSGRINIDGISNSWSSKIEILSPAGTCVLSDFVNPGENVRRSFNLSEQPAGLYLIRICSKETWYSFKVALSK